MAVSIERVPAWKRLGLKLKYTNEDEKLGGATTSSNKSKEKRDSGRPLSSDHDSRTKLDNGHGSEVVSGSAGGKRKRSDTDGREDPAPSSAPSRRKPKKPKQAKKEAQPKTNTVDQQTNDSVYKTNGGSPTSTSKRSNRVTFSADTKGEDEDSDQQLLSDWQAANPAEAAAFSSKPNRRSANVPLSPIDTVTNGQPNALSAKVTKRNKKKSIKSEQPISSYLSSTSPSSHSTTTNNTASPAVSPFLDYLSLYHNNRPGWKFNKARQSALLKHALDAALVPEKYSSALEAYVRGLQGKMARERLQHAAENVLCVDSDASDLDVPVFKGRGTMTSANANKNKVVQPTISFADQLSLAPIPTDKERSRQANIARGRQRLRDDERIKEQQSEQWRFRFQKRLRAETILRALDMIDPVNSPPGGGVYLPKSVNGDAEKSPAKPIALTRLRDGMPKTFNPRKRIRWGKLRTGVPDDDVVSSDSDSVDDEEDGGVRLTPEQGSPGDGSDSEDDNSSGHSSAEDGDESSG